MQKNILLKIEYLGTNYFGFQIQNKKGSNEVSVQSRLEEALKRLFKRPLRIIYASRTDRGVHAYEQAVNFSVDTNISLKNIKSALNAFLPSDIRIKSAKIVPLDFHARFWAKGKIYRYIILNRKESSVFWINRSWHLKQRLDTCAMRDIARTLVGRKNFALFAKEAKKYSDCTREIKNISLRKNDSFLYVDIEADGFLRNMVRNIVAFLIKVGLSEISPAQACDILQGKASYHNKPAPGCGLYLLKVKYS